MSTLAPRRPPATKPSSRDYLSYSAVSTYQACPLRYKFRYLDGLPEAMVSASLVFGSSIHRAAEHHYRELLAGCEPPTLDALLGEFNAAWQSYDLATIRFGRGKGREELANLAQRMLAAFQASDLARPGGAILGVEEELRGQIVPGCPDLLGRIDLIVETDRELVITDLKTARSRWSRGQVEESAGQLMLYHELARGLAPRKTLRLRFAVLTKTKQPTLDVHEVASDRRQIDRMKRIVERVWRAISNRHFYPAPSAANCGGCPFRAPCRAWRG
ncbi:MAG TPA: PD-(D/E)XK nuclease family protein [Pirellulales bacterium]|nr:PD-(D/E)XK nuclease family protein [Pirellulales bacterium]